MIRLQTFLERPSGVLTLPEKRLGYVFRLIWQKAGREDPYIPYLKHLMRPGRVRRVRERLQRNAS